MSRPRIRTLKPEFFADQRINEVSRDARYLAIGLITRADDRGRQQRMDVAILGHVYPAGDIGLKQLGRWLGELLRVGFVLEYGDQPFRFLWLPGFWRHQNINRPSESDLPAHPDDPYGDVPINDALSAFKRERRGEEVSDQFTESVSEDITPSRAGARSVPFRSSSAEGSQGEVQDPARELFEYWQERCDHQQAKLSADRRSKIRARLNEGRTIEECRQAIDGAAVGAFVDDRGVRHDDIELIFRNGAKFEQFLARASAPGREPLARQNPDGKRLEQEWLDKQQEIEGVA